MSLRIAPIGRFCLVVTFALPVVVTPFLTGVVVQSADVLGITSVSLDPPTLHALGVQMLISGDQNRNAQVTVRYRPAGSGVWREGPPLFRVFPETVPLPVPEQFAGSIFNLTPDTSYEIELHATDADGPVDEIRILTGRTRPVPRENPVAPTTITVASPFEFQSALFAAVPGDVIVLANGIYPGAFVLLASGTAENPIVIRGESASGVVLDGQNCLTCNVLEVYGSYVHVESLTIQNADRAVRFLGTETHDNVVRRLQVTNVVHGIGHDANQRDFYICDNIIEGRLAWPWVFQPDASLHWDDRGISVDGDGHVVCHNRMSGFGDPMINKKVLARSIDFYGNDILDSFDGTELDLGGGNIRAFGNRWTNVAVGVSLQPVYGGPAYVLRNVILNAVLEQVKLHALGTHEPSGALIYHNTFVSPQIALNHQAPITGHNFLITNNLFVGPRVLAGRAVEWTSGIDRGMFDFNGYFPDGGFWLGKIEGVPQIFGDFSALQASGVFEMEGTLLTEPIFAGGFVGPTDGTVRYDPADFTLAGGSSAVDRGTQLPGVNQSFVGAAPDLGALESGCPTPIYGPRPVGSEDVTAAIDCTPAGGNQAPVVSAGADQTITLPSTASLEGSATDDGQPNPPGVLTTMWYQENGPGTVTFSASDALSTTASFSAPGLYLLRLTASDGATTSADEVLVTVRAPLESGTGLTAQYYNDPGTGAHFGTLVLTRADPTVNFGWGLASPAAGVQADNYSVQWTGQVLAPVTGNHTFSTVSDDGVRLWVNGQLVIDNWTDHGATLDTSAPIALVADTKYDITMEFYEHTGAATAKLLWAYPGQAQTVIPQSRLFPPNLAPTVNAGADQIITLPTNTASVAGTATDDGQPNPPGALTTTWSQVSGPNLITFGNANALSTTASFSSGGLYVLRLTVSDGAIAVSDDLTITVNQPPMVNAGANQIITLPISTASLVGTATDDGQPNPPGVLTTTWSQASGPSLVTFGNANALSTTAIFLTSGAYVLRLTVWDGAAAASDDVAVTVSPASTIGTGLTGQYFNDPGTGAKFVTLALSRTDATVNFDWSNGSPEASVQADNFSVRWAGQVQAPVTGSYTFSTLSDDGVRLWVNGQLLIDNWTDHGATLDTSAAIALVADTKYDITMEFYERSATAMAKLGWAYPGQTLTVIPASRLFPGGTGLTGEYYNDPGTGAHFGTLVLTRTDPTVNFEWGFASPGAGVQADNYSVRWTGQVLAPVTGIYTFATVSDDGVRLWVNGQLVIDNWTNHGTTLNTSAPIALVAATKYDITMEFYESGGAATAKLGWGYLGQALTVIPQSRLYFVTPP